MSSSSNEISSKISYFSFKVIFPEGKISIPSFINYFGSTNYFTGIDIFESIIRLNGFELYLS